MSPRTALEVADVIRAHGAAFLASHGASLTGAQHRALAALAACRTPALGGHVEHCADCGAERIAYNSCRNRHCPKCQASQRAVWLEREASYLLPVEYHHVVFTLPPAVAGLALANPRLLYGRLFRAAWETLREGAADPHYLGATVGALGVLHTWGQNLHHHPHVHWIVTGGGLSCDAAGVVEERPRWRSCRPGFFLPVRVLGRVFRGKFLAGLREAHAAGRLCLGGVWAARASAAAFAAWLTAQYQQDWVVYSKPPFGGPAQVLKYLARYTHRVAISNRRLVSLSDDAVTFTYKDYARGGKERILTLTAEEFLRRFMQHVLPRGFVKVRHYGLLANREREPRRAQARALVGHEARVAAVAGAAVTPAEPPARCCPACGSQRLERRQLLPERVAAAGEGAGVAGSNTS
jgi:Putative transposase/Transposase zinc-binding domain